MILLETTLPPDHNYYLLGDDHEGALPQHTKALDEVIERIRKDPIGVWTHHGDACETRIVDHPYYDPRTLKKDPNNNMAPSQPQTQVQAQIERYKKIAKKGVAFLVGNHEWLVSLKYGDLIADICKGIGRPEIYGGYMCKIAIKDKKGVLMYKHLAYHGRRLIRSRAGTERQRLANSESSLQKILAPLSGDCVLQSMGDSHQLMVVDPLDRLYLYDDGKTLKQNYIKAVQTAEYIDPENRYYVNTGSFYRSQMVGTITYAERYGYAPVELGCAMVKVRKGVIQGIEKIIV